MKKIESLRRPRHALCSLTIGLALLAVWATRAQAETEINQLGQIEVIGTALSDINEKSGTSWRITSDEIAQRGLRTLDEALALAPGLNVRVGAEGVPRIDIRGLRTRQIKLLVNGIPINSAADGQFNPAMIPVGQIAEVIVKTGGSSVLYGDGGTAGVINVITRKGSGTTRATIDASMGTGNSSALSSSIAGASDRLDWFISADYAAQNFYRLPNRFVAQSGSAQQAGKRLNSDNNRNNVMANFGLSLTPDLRIGLGLQAGGGDWGQPPSAVLKDDFSADPRYERNENIDQRGLQLSADWSLASQTQLRGWFYANEIGQNEKRRYDNVDFSTALSVNNPGFNKLTQSQIAGYHTQLEHRLSDSATLSVALDTRKESYSENGTCQAGRTNSTKCTNNLSSINLEQQVFVDSLAAQYALRWNERSAISIGTGWIQQRRQDSADETGPTGVLSAYVDSSADLRWHASISHKLRMPTLVQLYGDNGSPDLKAEKVNTAEIGTRWHITPETRLDATLFQSWIRDFIERADSSSLNENRERYRIGGLELQARSTAFQSVSYGVGYSYLLATDLSSDAASRDLQYRPRHKISADALWRITPGSTASVTLLHLRDQLYFTKDSAPAFISAELPASTMVNIKLTFNLPHKGSQLYVGANNLFDQLIYSSYGFPQMGRYLYAGIRASF